MSKNRRPLIIAASVAILFAMVTVAIVRPSARTWICASDEYVPSAARTAVEKLALEFVDAAMGPDPSSADTFFSASAKVQSRENLGEIGRARRDHLGVLRARSIAHTYLTRLVAGNGQPAFATCGNPSQPEELVSVLTRPGEAQAHVLVEGRADHNFVAFVLWLVRENDQWRVLEAHVRPSGYMGKTSVDFEQTADSELRERHNLNAAVLYTEALVFADRGPTLTLGIVSRIVQERAAVKVPGPLSGTEPYRWVAGNSEFKIRRIGPIGLGDEKRGDQLWLMVFHEIESWTDSASIERRNRELLTSFDEKYPEYKSAFAGVVINGCEKPCGESSRGWGTVHENK